jgi:hypothetical protein
LLGWCLTSSIVLHSVRRRESCLLCILGHAFIGAGAKAKIISQNATAAESYAETHKYCERREI